MTNQPSAIELEVEVPGAPEDVWSAVATGPGISSWYVPQGDEVQVSVWTYRYSSEAGATAEADQSGWQTWLSHRAAS